MKEIIINGKHHDKLQAALDAAQGRSSARTLTVQQIERILSDAIDHLGITKKALTGTRIDYTGAESFPSAYRHTPYSTHVSARFDGRYWRIYDLDRYPCPDRYENTTLRLSDTAQQALLDRMTCVRL